MSGSGFFHLVRPGSFKEWEPMFDIGPPDVLVLIRHAQSARNAARRGGEVFFKDEASRDLVRDTPDHLTPLTEHGRKQAAQAAAALKARFAVPDEIIHSGYLRTEETAAIILSAYSEEERAKVSVRRDWRIRERQPGWAFNMTADEAAAAFPWLQRYWSETPAFFAFPPGGESLAQVADRVAPFLTGLLMGKRGRTTYVVSHGNTIRCLRFLIEEMTYDQVGKTYWPPNCGIVAYQFGPLGDPKLIADNERLCTK